MRSRKPYHDVMILNIRVDDVDVDYMIRNVKGTNDNPLGQGMSTPALQKVKGRTSPPASQGSRGTIKNLQKQWRVPAPSR